MSDNQKLSDRPSAVGLTVFVPCYNEEKLIALTLDHIQEAFEGFQFSYEVLIYDDASTDRSAEAIQAYVRSHHLEQRITLATNAENRGIGVNYFRAAERGRGEYFIVVAGDDGEPVETLRRVVSLMGKADVIIPYFDTRLFNLRLNGDNRVFSRRLISICFASLVRLLSGIHLHYFNGCILHRRENVLKYRVQTYGLGYQAEMLCKILSNPEVRFLEVKVYNQDRMSGKTTAFKPKNVVSVIASFGRILANRRQSG